MTTRYIPVEHGVNLCCPISPTKEVILFGLNHLKKVPERAHGHYKRHCLLLTTDGSWETLYPGQGYYLRFICPVGTPVRAAADGEVLEFNEDSSFYNSNISRIMSSRERANTVTLLHYFDNTKTGGGQYITTYAHLEKGSVTDAGLKVGQRVKRGDIIGRTGLSGDVCEHMPALGFCAFTQNKYLSSALSGMYKKASFDQLDPLPVYFNEF